MKANRATDKVRRARPLKRRASAAPIKPAHLVRPLDRDHILGVLRAHIDREQPHRLRAGIDPEMGDAHRLHESVARAIGALVVARIIHRQFALQNIGEQRHAVLMHARLLARRKRDDRSRDLRGTRGRIANGLADDAGPGRQQRNRRIGLRLGDHAARAFVRQCVSGDEDQTESEQAATHRGCPCAGGRMIIL